MDERRALTPYVLVRTDIPLADQIVQVSHVCLQAGHRFNQPEPPCHLVLLSVPSETHLQSALVSVRMAGVRYTVFYEPDEQMGYTAACTEPLDSFYKRIFRRFPLWRPDGLAMTPG
jgi:hypothetical protein